MMIDRSREPQPIILSVRSSRNRRASLPTVADHPRVRVACPCCDMIASAGDCYCGYCGVQLHTGKKTRR